MHVEFTRNASSGLIRLIKILKVGPVVTVNGTPHHILPFPITFVFGEPSERTIPWSWWAVSPYASFLGGLQGVSAASQALSRLDGIDQIYTCEFSIEGTIGQTLSFKKSLTGKLDMIVFERNLTELGSVFGISMCRCTMIQEFLAAHFGVPVGVYSHIVSDLVAQVEDLPTAIGGDSPYETGSVKPYQMVHDPRAFIADVQMLGSEGPTLGISDPFIKHVATPIYRSFEILHSGEDASRFGVALEVAGKCRASDWRYCCQEFIRLSTSMYLMNLTAPAKKGLLN